MVYLLSGPSWSTANRSASSQWVVWGLCYGLGVHEHVPRRDQPEGLFPWRCHYWDLRASTSRKRSSRLDPLCQFEPC